MFEVKTADRELSVDYALLQRLLECHTCRYCDITLLYRAPNCLNKNRVHFGISGHDAQLHGKCPAHEPMSEEKLSYYMRELSDVYHFGDICLAYEKQKVNEKNEEIKFLHKHLTEGLL